MKLTAVFFAAALRACDRCLCAGVILACGICPARAQQPAQNPVQNADFSEGLSYWTFWGRESGAGNAIAVSAGETAASASSECARITYTGDRDWAFSHSLRLPVFPGDSFRLQARMRCLEGSGGTALSAVGRYQGNTVSWRLGSTRPVSGSDWKTYTGYVQIPAGVDTIYLRFSGSGKTAVEVDDVLLVAEAAPPEVVSYRDLPASVPAAQAYNQTAGGRPEKLSRSVRVSAVSGGAYISWRLLAEDAPDCSFNVYRAVLDGSAAETPPLPDTPDSSLFSGSTLFPGSEKLTKKPLRRTTDFTDTDALRLLQNGNTLLYTVVYVPGKREPKAAGTPASAVLTPGMCLNPATGRPYRARRQPYDAIPLVMPDTAPDAVTVNRVAVADLNGDGEYDYIVKIPDANIDPADAYWKKSDRTYRICAYLSDGTYLWTYDLGVNIELGIWYSPVLAADFDGDGKAEVVLKGGDREKDWRDSDGRVQAGPEYLLVLDGMTGAELARADWISRDGFEDYNKASRNQLAAAYLDGNTLSIVALRGTYGLQRVETWNFSKNGGLVRVWSFSNEFLAQNCRGQGAHNTVCGDIDGDGCDEIVTGSLALDHTGHVLWTTGYGHPDSLYYGDIDPARRGMEIVYTIETKQKNGGGILQVNPQTGETLWKLAEPTLHVHSAALCSDIDPRSPGLEIYAADSIDHQIQPGRWLFSASGTLLKNGSALAVPGSVESKFSFAPKTVYWDADMQREIFYSGAVYKYYHADTKTTGSTDDVAVSAPLPGKKLLIVADISGDWREELVMALPGELRIYRTDIPAVSRRICLMQDARYRSSVMSAASGYYMVPVEGAR